jgi:adenylate kinase
VQQVIAISGTPGTGKTSVGNLLKERLSAELVDLSLVIKEHGLFTSRDTERDTLVADLDGVRQYLMTHLQQSTSRCIIVGHFADEVPDQFLEYLIVLRCHPVILTKRLRQRKWSYAKILENVQAEIMDVCTAQALQRHSTEKIFEVDTSELSESEVVDTIESIIAGQGSSFHAGKISWLRTLDAKLLHKIMEDGNLP